MSGKVVPVAATALHPPRSRGERPCATGGKLGSFRSPKPQWGSGSGDLRVFHKRSSPASLSFHKSLPTHPVPRIKTRDSAHNFTHSADHLIRTFQFVAGTFPGRGRRYRRMVRTIMTRLGAKLWPKVTSGPTLSRIHPR